VTELKRWFGVMGIASIIGFGVPLILRNSFAPNVRFALEGTALLAGVQLFYPMGWRNFVLAVALLMVATFVNLLPAMNTPAALMASWVGIVVVAIAISVLDRRTRQTSLMRLTLLDIGRAYRE
jgi:hypothetical protein